MNKEYKLLTAQGVAEMEKQINFFSESGWTPQGGLSIQEVMGSAVYTQTMVREKKGFNESNSDNNKQLLHG